jgi:hypothetical protein
VVVDDDVIDLTRYLNREEDAAPEEVERGFFSVWGGDGERSRFALPLWRSVYLAAGKRAGLLWASLDSCEDGTPLFVLDLGAEPARTAFPPISLPEGVAEDQAPSVLETDACVTIFLGTHIDRVWFIVLDERDEAPGPLEGKTREDLLFLAGECAGLLFHRGLAADQTEGDEPS